MVLGAREDVPAVVEDCLEGLLRSVPTTRHVQNAVRDRRTGEEHYDKNAAPVPIRTHLPALGFGRWLDEEPRRARKGRQQARAVHREADAGVEQDYRC